MGRNSVGSWVCLDVSAVKRAAWHVDMTLKMIH